MKRRQQIANALGLGRGLAWRIEGEDLVERFPVGDQLCDDQFLTCADKRVGITA